jgi:hypothetical protein
MSLIVRRPCGERNRAPNSLPRQETLPRLDTLTSSTPRGLRTRGVSGVATSMHLVPGQFASEATGCERGGLSTQHPSTDNLVSWRPRDACRAPNFYDVVASSPGFHQTTDTRRLSSPITEEGP